MFLTPSDFEKRPYVIPGAQTKSIVLQDFINSEGETILRKLLGHALYEAYIAGAYVAGVANPNPLVMWSNLTSGASYDIAPKAYRWKGINDMLIPYIYSQWIRGDYDTYTDGGVVMPKPENSEVLNPVDRMVNSWNDFARKAGAGRCSTDSLYGYITVNKELVYPSFSFCDPGFKNKFNL